MPKEPPPKPRPTCPTCDGTKYQREVIRLYDEKAMQKKPLVMLTCTKCSHALFFNGMSSIFDVG